MVGSKFAEKTWKMKLANEISQMEVCSYFGKGSFLESLHTPIFSCIKKVQEKLISLNSVVYFNDLYLTSTHNHRYIHPNIYVYL